jgi:hypothetical protein
MVPSMPHSETTQDLTGAFANLGLIPPTATDNLETFLIAYPGKVTGQLPKGEWKQEQIAFRGLGELRIVLNTYTDVLYEGDGPRPQIMFSVDMSNYGGILRFKELINIIHDQIFDHFINPLDNGASIIHNIEGAYDDGKLWLGYYGIELEYDQHGSYYLIQFTD